MEIKYIFNVDIQVSSLYKAILWLIVSCLFEILLLPQSSQNYQVTFKNRCENQLDFINVEFPKYLEILASNTCIQNDRNRR